MNQVSVELARTHALTDGLNQVQRACLTFVGLAQREVHLAEIATGVGRSPASLLPGLVSLRQRGHLCMRVGSHPDVRGPGALLYSLPAEPAPAPSEPVPVAVPVVASPSGQPPRRSLPELVQDVIRRASRPLSVVEISALIPGSSLNSISPTVSMLASLGAIAPEAGVRRGRARCYRVSGDVPALTPQEKTARRRQATRAILGETEPLPPPPAPAHAADTVDLATLNAVRVLRPVTGTALADALRGEYPVRGLQSRLARLVQAGRLAVVGSIRGELAYGLPCDPVYLG